MANLEKTKSCNTQHNSEHNSVVDNVLLDDKNHLIEMHSQMKKNWNTRTCKHGMKTYKNYMALIKSALFCFCSGKFLLYIYCINSASTEI